METMQANASRIIRATTLPVPRNEAIARVEVEKYMELPPCTPKLNGCLMVAKLVWQWALENGCTIIEVCKGPYNKHRFDILDLVKSGQIRPRRKDKQTHSLMGHARAGHGQMGSYQDTMKNYVPVGTSFSANGRRKETVL